jgi:hypothetical protein
VPQIDSELPAMALSGELCFAEYWSEVTNLLGSAATYFALILNAKCGPRFVPVSNPLIYSQKDRLANWTLLVPL